MVKNIFGLMLLFILAFDTNAAKVTSTTIGNTAAREAASVVAPQSTTPQVTEQQRIAQSATSFGVTTQEWTRYESIMQGEGKYHWSDADPVLVLGMYAKSESERRRYAEMMAKKEHALQEKFIAFNREYLKAFERLYGNEKILDMDVMMALYEQNGQSDMNDQLQVNTKAPNALDTMGDRIILFVNTTCPACDEYFKQIRSAQSYSSLDIYFVGDSRDNISAWARRMGVAPEEVRATTVTLNPDKDTHRKYGSPALPASYYFNKKDGSVSAFVPE
jgi:integrating conjugative element protein (TIGR03759 family)